LSTTSTSAVDQFVQIGAGARQRIALRECGHFVGAAPVQGGFDRQASIAQAREGLDVGLTEAASAEHRDG
jgi:hypothetical protein